MDAVRLRVLSLTAVARVLDEDLRGREFGDLHVTDLARLGPRGKHVWSCLCVGCGRELKRAASQLLSPPSRVQMCLECAREMRSGAWQQQREIRKTAYLEMWERSGTLYGHVAIKSMENAVAEELTAEGFPPPDEAVKIDYDAMSLVQNYQGSETPGQLAAFLAPMSGRAWRCRTCGQIFDEGFACLACKQPTCRACVRDEVHVCDASRKEVYLEVMQPERLEMIAATGSKNRRNVEPDELPLEERRRLAKELRRARKLQEQSERTMRLREIARKRAETAAMSRRRAEEERERKRRERKAREREKSRHGTPRVWPDPKPIFMPPPTATPKPGVMIWMQSFETKTSRGRARSRQKLFLQYETEYADLEVWMWLDDELCYRNVGPTGTKRVVVEQEASFTVTFSNPNPYPVPVRVVTRTSEENSG